jgi:hypothetical protein
LKSKKCKKSGTWTDFKKATVTVWEMKEEVGLHLVGPHLGTYTLDNSKFSPLWIVCVYRSKTIFANKCANIESTSNEKQKLASEW